MARCAQEQPYQDIPKDTLKQILIEANKRRFSPAVQNDFNVWDNSRWFAIVVDRMHAQLLTEFGYADNLAWAISQLYTARWRFREDKEMNDFFNTLIHVQMDFTGDGPLQVNDLAPSVPLVDLNGSATSLDIFISNAKKEGIPLVIFAGSWT